MSDRCVDCGYYEPPRTSRRIGGGMTISIEQLEALAACPPDVCPGGSCCFYHVGRYSGECLRPEEPREIAQRVLDAEQAIEAMLPILAQNLDQPNYEGSLVWLDDMLDIPRAALEAYRAKYPKEG